MDLKEGISRQFNNLNVKTSNFLEEGKIKGLISALEEDIKTLKLQVGELCYKNYETGTEDPAAMEAIFAKIGEKKAGIEEYNERLRKLAEEKHQVDNAGQVRVDAVFCPKCGKQYPVTVNFCVNCGTRLH